MDDRQRRQFIRDLISQWQETFQEPSGDDRAYLMETTMPLLMMSMERLLSGLEDQYQLTMHQDGFNPLRWMAQFLFRHNIPETWENPELSSWIRDAKKIHERWERYAEEQRCLERIRLEEEKRQRAAEAERARLALLEQEKVAKEQQKKLQWAIKIFDGLTKNDVRPARISLKQLFSVIEVAENAVSKDLDLRKFWEQLRKIDTQAQEGKITRHDWLNHVQHINCSMDWKLVECGSTSLVQTVENLAFRSHSFEEVSEPATETRENQTTSASDILVSDADGELLQEPEKDIKPVAEETYSPAELIANPSNSTNFSQKVGAESISFRVDQLKQELSRISYDPRVDVTEYLQQSTAAIQNSFHTPNINVHVHIATIDQDSIKPAKMCVVASTVRERIGLVTLEHDAPLTYKAAQTKQPASEITSNESPEVHFPGDFSLGTQAMATSVLAVPIVQDDVYGVMTIECQPKDGNVRFHSENTSALQVR
jgi:hypothetical protein